MATAWKKALIWLGLGTDEDYELADQASYGPNGAPQMRPQPQAQPQPQQVPQQRGQFEEPLRQVPPAAYPEPVPSREVPEVRPIPQPATPSAPQAGGGSTTKSNSVRPLPPASNAKPRVVSPGAFNDAQQVADIYRGKQPVIVNLQNADRELSRRLIDFSSGLCYGLGGRMEKVADHVYLLTPSDVEVSAEERRRWEERRPPLG